MIRITATAITEAAIKSGADYFHNRDTDSEPGIIASDQRIFLHRTPH